MKFLFIILQLVVFSWLNDVFKPSQRKRVCRNIACQGKSHLLRKGWFSFLKESTFIIDSYYVSKVVRVNLNSLHMEMIYILLYFWYLTLHVWSANHRWIQFPRLPIGVNHGDFSQPIRMNRREFTRPIRTSRRRFAQPIRTRERSPWPRPFVGSALIDSRHYSSLKLTKDIVVPSQ